MPSHYDKPLPTEKPAPPSQQKAVIQFAEDEGLPEAATRALLKMSAAEQRSFMAMARETTQNLTTEDLRNIMNLEEDRKTARKEREGLLKKDAEERRGLLASQLSTTQRKAPPLAKQAYGGMMKPKKKKMMGGGMAGKKPRVGNMDYRKGGMVYSTKVKKG